MSATKAEAAQEVPCHGVKQSSNLDKVTMLFKDCSGIDLAQVDHSQAFQKPDIQTDKVLYVFSDFTAVSSLTPASTYQIRGPPIIAASYQAYPPLFLTTQRLRI